MGFLFFLGTKQTCLGLSRGKLILLFAVLTTLEALVTVENLHAERVEVTWDPVRTELQAKASFCVYRLSQGGFCIFHILYILRLCGLRRGRLLPFRCHVWH